MPKPPKNLPANIAPDYDTVFADVAALLETARRAAARSVNSVMTATYWQIGRRLVEVEQGGEERAEYGVQLLKRLSTDLTQRFGRGFSQDNLEKMRQFYLVWPIRQTLTGESGPASEKAQTLSAKSETVSRKLPEDAFPISWSHYVRLLSVRAEEARRFYETEALRGGWSLRQLDRQIAASFMSARLFPETKQPCSPKARRRSLKTR